MGVEETSGVIAGVGAPPIPAQQGGILLESALRYVRERQWDVLPGAWLEIDNGAMRCSCADFRCDAPGAHPLRRDWSVLTSGSAMMIRRLWSREPRASILLPTGRAFDVLEVPEPAGCLALARMARTGVEPGPVAVTPGGRMQFFVLPGSTAGTDELVRRLGWSTAALDLTPLGEGCFVAAPPTRLGRGGVVRWVNEPTPANRWLPDAAELITPLAYACAQEK
ncbi:bifunctional DNA primase/polymerase [Streptomyces litchfieldiae]|uniref:Bifunctional DNA primase/polymerase n=1 Tax=Streptomyces litchfieldiae TaxID=3075543 RepID=A0ABU2MNP3_9ACTN|nr:bifunctional DNA primase/polymerase [Streptomyces sp. DSM 44938]MDT0343180.1 bifunctional DNA primase/polymerase [Streptomyces sp. DSM 44938]